MNTHVCTHIYANTHLHGLVPGLVYGQHLDINPFYGCWCACPSECSPTHLLACVHVCVRVCVHACVRACIPACVPARVPVCLLAYLSACVHTRLYARTHAYTHARARSCKQARTCTCTHADTLTSMHALSCTWTDAHVRMHVQRLSDIHVHACSHPHA